MVLAVLTMLAAPALSGHITYDSFLLQTSDAAYDPASDSTAIDIDTLPPGAFPWNATSVASASATSSASSEYTYSDSILGVVMSHLPADSSDGFSKHSSGQSFGEIFFTPSVDSTYSVSGDYTFSGGPGDMFLDVFIQDTTTSALVFRNRQISFNVAGVNFTVGGSDGTLLNENVGSPSGSLSAGTQYRYRYQWTLIDRSSSPASPMTGSGDLTLQLLPDRKIPEPSTFALLGLGLIAIVARRRSVATR